MEWDFNTFYEWAQKHLKLELHAYKEKQLQRRINTVMGQAGATSLADYSKLIQRDPIVREEFLDYITINVTDFFRNKELFDNFEELLVSRLAPQFGPLKIWSAACSTGAEPYSLAMIVHKHNLSLKENILGTDLDETVLSQARESVYTEFELKNLPLLEKKEYFRQSDKKYVLDRRIRQNVTFKKHDLLRDSFGKDYHAIICRNVTIYFKTEVKNDLYQRFSDALVPGGLLFTGATETIYRPEQFGLKKVASFIYEKM
ncbi:CheR family methyltransferase [Atopococcus tabaci]|uniref:CheR family methyltransferase n=1 Tax=Atopococcus tabaci TaxID=269774 RepID=UPI00041064BB|nr:protein-glutamate O-methyltransferase CheR [Atopococcus tabaci]